LSATRAPKRHEVILALLAAVIVGVGTVSAGWMAEQARGVSIKRRKLDEAVEGYHRAKGTWPPTLEEAVRSRNEPHEYGWFHPRDFSYRTGENGYWIRTEPSLETPPDLVDYVFGPSELAEGRRATLTFAVLATGGTFLIALAAMARPRPTPLADLASAGCIVATIAASLLFAVALTIMLEVPKGH
jgi:hypothetical protein